MVNELQIFNNKDFGEVRVVVIEGKEYFVGLDIARSLGYVNASKAVGQHCKNIIKHTLEAPSHNGNMIKTEVNLILEGDVYRLIFRSNLPSAEAFEEWIMEEVLPTLRKTGKLDIIEQNLQIIEDKTERELSLGLYAIEQALKANPHDVTLSIMCDNKRLALESYKQSIKLNNLENKTNQIEEKLDKMTVVGDRVEFKREVDSICRATGCQQYEVFSRTYNKLKDMYGVDVVARTKNARDKIQEDRVENGKKPYAESTLNSKVNPLDIVEELNMWKEISKCLSSVRMELIEI